MKLAERGARVAVHYYQNEDAAKGTLAKIRECGSAANHQPPLGLLRCLYRFHYGQEIPGQPHFQRRYTTRSPLGYGRRQPRITTNLQLRQPRRVIVPLSADQVGCFWKGFRTFRDLAVIALMLLDGLRSC